MKISKFIPCALLVAACGSALMLTSCGSDSSSSSSSSKDLVNLTEPYQISAVSNDGVSDIIHMTPASENSGSFSSSQLGHVDDTVARESSFEWIRLPDAATRSAELRLTHKFEDPADASNTGEHRYTLQLTFSDPTTATATWQFIMILNEEERDMGTLVPLGLEFSVPMY